jgi:hypothetical protein
MANVPAWNDNALACYPYVLERLREVSQVKRVLEAADFAAISGAQRKQVPLDGAVYLILDGYTPTASNGKGREQLIEIGFSVILTKQQFTPNPASDDVGKTLTALSKALQGFDPSDAQGRALVTDPFESRPPLPIQYEDGFAFFPLRFTAEVAILSDN